MSAYTGKERFHAMDSLRASMMLLGVVLHAALAYAKYTLGVISAYHDPANSYLLSGLTFLIHLFRMPAFFLVGGFFAALLYHNRGGAGLLKNRCKRVLLPLIVGWIVLFPITILGAAFTMLGGPKGVSTVIDQLQSGAVLAKNDLTFYDLLTQLGLIHLWFLYYLLIYYVIMLLLIQLLRRFPAGSWASLRQAYARLIFHPLGIMGLALLTFITMLAMPVPTAEKAGFQNSNAWIPPLQVLAAYFVFFAVGWLLFNARNLMPLLQNGIGWKLSLGVLLGGVYALSIVGPGCYLPHVVQTAVVSLAVWLLVLGVLGGFLRYAGHPSPIARYLSDASYWVYLIHLPLTLFLPGLLIDVPLPSLAKFMIVCSTTLAICLCTYHYLVRATKIGQLLNGKRYPRSLPKAS